MFVAFRYSSQKQAKSITSNSLRRRLRLPLLDILVLVVPRREVCTILGWEVVVAVVVVVVTRSSAVISFFFLSLLLLSPLSLQPLTTNHPDRKIYAPQLPRPTLITFDNKCSSKPSNL